MIGFEKEKFRATFKKKKKKRFLEDTMLGEEARLGDFLLQKEVRFDLHHPV